MPRNSDSAPLPKPVNTPAEAMKAALAPVVRDDAGNLTVDVDPGGTHHATRGKTLAQPMVRIRNAAGTEHLVPKEDVQYLLAHKPRWTVVDALDEFEGDDFMAVLKRYTDDELRAALEKLEITVPHGARKTYLAVKVFEEGGLDLMETLFPREED